MIPEDARTRVAHERTLIENQGALRLAVWVLLLLYTLLLLRNAWLTDDAFITLRAVSNFVTGYGPRWNVSERVQVFTHPLWMIVLSAAYYVTDEAYYTVLGISAACSFGALALLVRRISRSTLHAFVALVLLVCSRGFIDYSTSGLENPLTHLLCAAFVATYVGGDLEPRRFLRMCVLAGLSTTNRLDTVLLFLPALGEAALRLISGGAKPRQVVAALAWGALPVVLWESFAIVYYGFPFPNTAYAKVFAGIERKTVIAQGAMYFVSTLERDPSTLFAILLGFVAAFRARNRRATALMSGVILTLVYVLFVGGDFMLSRFFTPALVLAVSVAAAYEPALDARSAVVVCFGTLVFALSIPMGHITLRPTEPHGGWDERGVSDERDFYIGSSLVRQTRFRVQPEASVAPRAFGARANALRGEPIHQAGAVGYLGYASGTLVYILDDMALTDPLRARMPRERRLEWRTGHLNRRLPDGYLETLELLETGKPYRCLMKEPGLCDYFGRLLAVVRGPIWSLARFREIGRFLTGKNDQILDRETYRLYDRIVVGFDKASAAPKQRLSQWDAPDNWVFLDTGVEVTLPEPRTAKEVEVSLDSNDDYVMQFLSGRTLLAEVPIAGHELQGLEIYRLAVPAEAAEARFDKIRILPVRGDEHYSMGHLVLR